MALFYQTAIIEFHQEEIAVSALYCLLYLMAMVEHFRLASWRLPYWIKTPEISFGVTNSYNMQNIKCYGTA
jgi:hypothetical protein